MNVVGLYHSRVTEVDSRVDEVGSVDRPPPLSALWIEVPRAHGGGAHREGLGHEMARTATQHNRVPGHVTYILRLIRQKYCI